MYLTRIILLVIFVSFHSWATAQYSTGGYNKHPVPLKKLATCQEFDIASQECKHFFPIETFNQVQSNEYKLYLKFYVMTTNDANIVLSNALNTTANGSVKYTIVVGGFADTYSWLRNTAEKTVGLDSRMADVLSPLWATPIVVRQKHSGELEVAIPNVVDPLLKANASELEVMSLCLYAWRADSRWFYNCAEEDEENSKNCVAIVQCCFF